jgi:AsmA protein
VNVTAEGPADRLITSGSLGLDRTRLAGFDLGSKIKTVATVAGIKAGPDTDIQTFSANVRAAPEGTSVQNLVLVAPAIGELSGAGTVSPSHALDFKMLVKLHTSGVMMTALGSKGDTSVPFFVRGTSSAPSFAPDVKGMASGQIQSILNRSGAAKTAGGLLDNLLGKKK